jgi:putative peptidoglycan lipid II flippase
MLSRLSGFLRDVAMAYAFGTQSAIAALLVAFRFAHLLRRLLGEGAMQTAFIPHFEGLRRESSAGAAQFFIDLNLSLTYLLITIIVLASAFLGSVYMFGNLSADNAEIVWLTLLMMPSLPFICLFGVNASLLQCEKSYFVPSAAPITFNLVWIIGIFSVSHLEAPQAMCWLAGFIVFACFCQWASTLPKTYQLIKEHHLPSLWQQSRNFSKTVRQLATPLALGILGVAAAQINSALDAIFARWADPQGPALLWYAIRLQQLPLALFGIALSGALLPPLSRAIKSEDWNKYRYFLDFALKRSLVLMIPITVLLFIAGDRCISLIYGHGDFTDASIVGTTKALWGYSFGLIPMTLVLVIAPAFYAQNDYKTPSIASVNSVIVNCLLSLWFVGVLRLGADSVAWATGISAWVNLGWLGLALYRNHNISFSQISFKGFVIGMITFVAGACTLLVDSALFGPLKITLIVNDLIPEYPKAFTTQILQLTALLAIFIGILVIVLYPKRVAGKCDQDAWLL